MILICAVFLYADLSIDKKRICDKIPSVDAGIAHPVERHLAKVEVASSSLVARSMALLQQQ